MDLLCDMNHATLHRGLPCLHNGSNTYCIYADLRRYCNSIRHEKRVAFVDID